VHDAKTQTEASVSFMIRHYVLLPFIYYPGVRNIARHPASITMEL